MKLRDCKGQGLVEYTLIVVLVVLVFWVVVRNSHVENSIQDSWTDIKGCLDTPLACK